MISKAGRRPQEDHEISARASLQDPATAFYGNQFGNTFELFNHYGIPLWVPEVGGPIDPANEAHELIMLMFGGISKGERIRIKIRVRATMEAQAKLEGRFLGGRPPYGYRLADAGPHPNPGKAADGKRLHRLEPDPVTAPVVVRIFHEFVGGDGRRRGKGLHLIAEGLTRDGIPCPSAYDAARNRHRSGVAWAGSAVRAILLNPRYTGRQVWNRQHKQEELLDVNDVTLGHTTKLKWNQVDKWVWSEKVVHQPLIDVETFERAQLLLSTPGRAAGERKPRTTRRAYVFRGLLRCGVCDRRMEGTWNNDRAHYRCKYPVQYALANKIDHPRTVYVREDHIMAELDPWICRIFSPGNLRRTVEALEQAQRSQADLAAIEAARRTIEDCDRRMSAYRATLDAGGDPGEIAAWMTDTRKRRTQAEGRLRDIERRTEYDAERINEMIERLGNMTKVLNSADPADKNTLDTQMGIHLTYDPAKRLVKVEAMPTMYPTVCPRGDLN
jgi:site-specific DNA recombinase